MDCLVAAGDVHLRRSNWSDMPSLVGDSYVALWQIKDYCLRRRLEGDNVSLVLPGDLHDTITPPSEAVVFLQSIVGELDSAGVPVYILDGNHDPACKGGRPDFPPKHLLDLQMMGIHVDPSWTYAIPKARYIDLKPFEPIQGVWAFGISYRPMAEFEKLMPHIPPQCRLLFCHQMWDWSMPIEGRYNAKAEWVPRYVEMVVSGDDHTPKTWGEPEQLFVYTGSPYMLRLGENHQKEFSVVESIEGRLRHTSVPLLARPFFEISINTEQQLNAFLATAPAEFNPSRFTDHHPLICKPLLKIVYHTGVDSAATRMSEVLRPLVHYKLFPYSLDAMTRPEVKDTESEVDEITVDSVLSECMDPEAEKQEFLLTRDLLTHPNDVKAILRQFKEDCGVVETPTNPLSGG